MDNLQLIENNNLNNPPNNEDDDNEKLNGYDNLQLYLNIVPSLIYSLLIILILIFPGKDDKEEYLSQTHQLILYLKLILIIYLLYALKGLFLYYIISKSKINITPKMAFEIFYILLDLSYFIFSTAGYKSFKKLSLDFIINNIYKCIFIYSLIFIGYIHIFLFFVNIFVSSIYLIWNLTDFLKDEVAYFGSHRGTFHILQSLLKRQKADINHIDECSICLREISLGDAIIILGCSDKHFFHEQCIIKWLNIRFFCPLCKSVAIF